MLRYNNKYKVLLIGHAESYSVGAFFRQALQNLGIDFKSVDMQAYYGRAGLIGLDRIFNRLFGKPIVGSWMLDRDLQVLVNQFRPQVVLIVKGSLLSGKVLNHLKIQSGAVLVNFATDDPFNVRLFTKNIVDAIPFYDLFISTKRAIMDDVRQAGCQNVIFVPFGYEPTMHFPEKPVTSKEQTRFSSDVVFIGAADTDRYPMMRSLANIPDLKLHLYGGYWDRYRELKNKYYGFAVGRDFRMALSSTKIAPGLVRRANRDGHCMRTFEVPACGAFMLAERTAEHQEYFSEDKEVAFFDTDDELVDKALFYIKHDSIRNRIAKNGYRHIVRGKNTYTDRMESILSAIQKLCS